MINYNLCPKVEEAFKIISKKWNALIVRVLFDGPKRFSEAAAEIPDISDRMLTKRFKELEEKEIIKRNVYPKTPVKIEYTLTKKGEALKPIISAIEEWAENWF